MPLYTGSVQSGRLKLSNRRQFDADIIQYEGKRVEIELKEARRTRSAEQNRYYWSVVLPHALDGLKYLQAEPLDIDTVHRFFKEKFIEQLQTVTDPQTGEVRQYRTTTKLSKSGMMDYIESICRWCAEFLNVIIPEPNERQTTE